VTPGTVPDNLLSPGTALSEAPDFWNPSAQLLPGLAPASSPLFLELLTG